jgi:hypothetical protein
MLSTFSRLEDCVTIFAAADRKISQVSHLLYFLFLYNIIQ